MTHFRLTIRWDRAGGHCAAPVGSPRAARACSGPRPLDPPMRLITAGGCTCGARRPERNGRNSHSAGGVRHEPDSARGGDDCERASVGHLTPFSDRAGWRGA